MKTSELDYTLPEELIAQHPCEKRDESRLLVLNRADHSLTTDVFRNLPRYLHHGDCLALNDTRVIRARLRARKPTGGQVEVFLLHETAPGEWDALVRPSSKVKPGTAVRIAPGIDASVGERLPGGRRHVSFAQPDVLSVLEKAGEVPLPPYIHRDKPDASDLTSYQTIYATVPGAVAAPTAGLHFTNEVFRNLEEAAVARAFLTLHVGYGTFRPIQAENLEEHALEPEQFTLDEACANTLNNARERGGRIVAVGTTVTRVLETQFRNGTFQPGSGETSHYIYPPYEFHAVDVLQTNFHLPRSSLLALICAFAGTDFVLEAYRFAVNERFRFYSYGDAMLIL